LKKKTIQYKFQASSTLIDMETSWTTFKKNINFSEYEENMKEKNQEILDEKNPSTTKTKIKKKDFKSFSIWLQCHTEGCHGA